LTKNQLITSLYSSADIDAYIRRHVAPHDFDDFKQDIFLILLNKKEGHLETRENIVGYVKQIIRRETGETGRLRNKYRIVGEVTESHDKPYESDYEYKLRCEECEGVIIREFEKIGGDGEMPYYRKLIEEVVKEGSHRKVADKIGIPRRTISRHVGKVKQYLNDNPDVAKCLPCLGMGVPTRYGEV
jgi:hypothetical protein